MGFRKRFENDNSRVWKLIGLLLMVAGAVWGCFELFVFFTHFSWERLEEITGFKSIPFGLIVIGYVLYLIGKAKRQQLFELQVLEQLDELNKNKSKDKEL